MALAYRTIYPENIAQFLIFDRTLSDGLLKLYLLLINYAFVNKHVLIDLIVSRSDQLNTHNCVRGTRTQPLICVGCSVHYWVTCAINKGGFLRFHFRSSSSSTHICLALRRLLKFCLTLTR